MTDHNSVEAAQILHWNLSNEGIPAILFLIDGDPEAFSELLGSMSEVRSFSISILDDGQFYLHTRGETTPVERTLYDAFTLDSLLVIPPLRYTEDGGVNFSVVGDPDELRAAISDVPDGVGVTVEYVGEYENRNESVASVLSNRQREAVTVALKIGYYNTPREATVDDVTEEMGCARSTAAEHLQRAESQIVSALL